MKPTNRFGAVALLAALAGFLTVSAAGPSADPEPKARWVITTTDDDGRSFVVGKVYGEFDVPPRALFEAAAYYSKKDFGDAREGVAIVGFVVKSDGSTADFSSRGSNKALITSAYAAARRNKYAPATLQGKPVTTRMELLYTFPGPNTLQKG